jgi:hypothetical protein
MKKNNHRCAGRPVWIFRMGILSILILFLQAFNSRAIAQYVDPGKRSDSVHNHSDTVTRWSDWNILFHEGATADQIDKLLTELKSYIEKYIDSCNIANPGIPPLKVDTHLVHCPCDPRLYNLNTTPIGASGSIIPPPPPPGHGGSGDLVAINNTTRPEIIRNEKARFLRVQVKFHNAGVDKSKTLAVMDTGLDVAWFVGHFGGLLWADPTVKPTLLNFQFYHNGFLLDYMQDDNAHLHGTAVTTLALTEFEKATRNSKPLPRVMVLKVLDDSGKGNSFAVSCALSYVAQKNATLINASLGYYSNGIVDTILSYYVDLCTNKKSIPMIAAAGNNPIYPHHQMDICGPKDKGRELNKKFTFDPGSYNTKYPNVISATTLKSSTTPCRLQNYSPQYVSVGVVNNPSSCCQFSVPFFSVGYEGSSFATPFVSGNIMACLTESGATLKSCQIQWSKVPAGGPTPVTKGGKFIDNR